MSPVNQTEIEKLSLMYKGDEARDASSSFRGFLYQDYIAIACLLEKNVECICSEYLEDVDVFLEDGTFEFIQVKYYPASDPKMPDIATDLYYQYLRLKLLDSNLTAVPKLYIHRQSATRKPKDDKMAAYVGTYLDPGEQLPPKVNYPDYQSAAAWLKADVYATNNKDDQKRKLFRKMASVESLKEFRNALTITPKPNITQCRDELMNALLKAYPNPDPWGDDESWKLILLGVALSCIQQRYTSDDSVFEHLRVKKHAFDQYIREHTQTKTEQTIAGYLVVGVAEVYEEIISHNALSDLQREMLGRIYRKTSQWIGTIASTPEGQYQLLNTLSKDDIRRIARFQGQTPADRFTSISECRDAFHSFLKYLWKIMLDICQEKLKTRKAMDDHPELFDPNYYHVSSVTDYVCLNFPRSKSENHTVILPRAGSEFKGVKRKIVERIVKMSPKPEKWFFENSKLTRGKNFYSYSTADVNENPTIADLGRDSFYIECMDCIGIDEGEWCDREICGDCIFSMECVKKEGSR